MSSVGASPTPQNVYDQTSPYKKIDGRKATPDLCADDACATRLPYVLNAQGKKTGALAAVVILEALSDNFFLAT